ncbi:hypothetical protein ABTY96_30445 [Streptomyces sp. NPDC096057]|uniref:hypothetical protein n=1 Tax=Streptomyces sp. NPDC096057 TaxID=3155543 RepID=UPI0033241483
MDRHLAHIDSAYEELVALKGGDRESAESWADLLHDCARPGLDACRLGVARQRWPT